MGIVSSRLSNRIKELCSPFYLQSQFLFSLEAQTITLRHVRTLAAEGYFFLQSYQSRTRSLVRIPMGQTISKVFAAVPVMIALIYAKTGGCNYWTWVPHFLLPPGHHNCKLFKNFCCFREVKDYYPHDHDGVGIRISGSKFQYCPPGHKGDGY